MPPNVSGPVPEVFARSLRELSLMPWRPHFVVDEIGSPQRIAPYAVAVSGELEGDEDPRALGRLILLHDPAGNSAWGGTFRLVTYANAEVEIEIVASDGARSRRLVRPLRLSGGSLVARDLTREADVTVALHRVASVAQR